VLFTPLLTGLVAECLTAEPAETCCYEFASVNGQLSVIQLYCYDVL